MKFRKASYFLNIRRENLRKNRTVFAAFIKEVKRQQKENQVANAKKELDNPSEPHTIISA
jgi:hypothetical protein